MAEGRPNLRGETPYWNDVNEWYVRDSSRKVRAVLHAKAERGERLGTRAPYGYRKDENDRKKLVVDEEAAATVCRIFAPKIVVHEKGTTWP